jgi:hypothetical protein
MGREIRHVPKNWEHPKKDDGRYKPLLDGKFSDELNQWNLEKKQWELGFKYDYATESFVPKTDKHMSFIEWNGSKPNKNDYMPEWDEKELTHIMMYETTSEGTPISPAFETPEELAKWLFDNNASAFAGMTATYEQWLHTCKSGYAPSAVLINGEIKSGVEAI